MLSYIVKRIFLFIPSLIVISLVTFVISINAPGDPVEEMLRGADKYSDQTTLTVQSEAYRSMRKRLGLDLPVFYFSVTTSEQPDTLYKIADQSHRSALSKLANDCGCWDEVQHYYVSALALGNQIKKLRQNTVVKDSLIEARIVLAQMLKSSDASLIPLHVSRIENLLTTHFGDKKFNALDELILATTALAGTNNSFARLKPVIHWYGFNNQYHNWIIAFVQGDFGLSYVNSQPVSHLLWMALRWTVSISLIALLLAYLIAIPIGVRMGSRPDTKFEGMSSLVLYALYSLPTFWVASMLIMFFGGGDFFKVFPSYGVGDEGGGILNTIWHLILPVFCFAYPGLAFLARHTRRGINQSLQQEYIKTAYAKGIPKNKIIWKHAFKNAAIPQIVIIAGIIPSIISGSMVLEYIFSIPGMGRLAYDAVLARNYPIVFSVMMMGSILTLFGYLLGDILYTIVDPRIRFKRARS